MILILSGDFKKKMNEIIDLIVGIVALLICVIPALIIVAKLLRVGRLIKRLKAKRKETEVA